MYFQVSGTNVRIAGSIHIFPSYVKELPRWLLDAYDWADELVFEGDAQEIAKLFLRTDPASGEQLLSPDVWQSLRANWQPDFPDLDRIHPWAASMYLAGVQNKVVHGVEPKLTIKAERNGKPVSFLETGEDFVNSMALAPMSDWDLCLKEALSHLHENKKSLEGLFNAWSRRNLAAMYSQVETKPLITMRSIRNAMLLNRNRAWLQPVLQLLDSKKKVLIVVGALHLYESGSLLAELQQAGYSATLRK